MVFIAFGIGMLISRGPWVRSSSDPFVQDFDICPCGSVDLFPYYEWFAVGPVCVRFYESFQELIPYISVVKHEWSLWHYRLWNFQCRDTKLERFLHKNQP